MSSRLTFVCLVLLLSGCNLFASTPGPADASISDISMPFDTGGGLTDMDSRDSGDGMDVTDQTLADLSSDLASDVSSDVSSDAPRDEEMGGPCTSNRACPIDLACIDGACVDRLAVNEACTESDDCLSGFCTIDGMCRELVTPLARYRMDEAAAGTVPPVLRDDAPDPLDLALSYEGASGWHEDRDGNRYVGHVGSEAGGAAAIMGTKIESAFDGGMTGTLEVKSMTFLCENNQHRVLGIGTGGTPLDDGWFTLREISGYDYLWVKFLPTSSPVELRPDSNGCLTAAPVVTHVVVDTTRLGASDRVRMYVDGRRIPLVSDSGAALPMLNQGLDIGLPATERYLFVGRPNPVSGGRATDQRVWYAALYQEALSEPLVQRNAAQILRRDDQPGGSGIVTRTVGSSGDFASLQAWYDARKGDLTRRFVVRITDTSGTFEAGEDVTSAGCSGSVTAEDRFGTRPDLLTLDDYEPGCTAGTVLTGSTSGASARFGGVLLRGTSERAAILDSAAAGAVLEGSTTDADHYFSVTPASDMLHRGSPLMGAAIEPVADGLLIRDPFTRVERLRVVNTPAGSAGIRIAASDVTVQNALIAASSSDAIQIAADRAVIEDSIVFDAGRGIVHQSGVDVVLRNLTLVGITGAGIQSVGGATAQNVIADGTPGFAADAAWAAAAGNISSDASAPGADAQTNVDPATIFVSLEPLTLDLHLAAGSPAIRAGVDTGAVSWDIDLRARPTNAFDSGADQTP